MVSMSILVRECGRRERWGYLKTKSEKYNFFLFILWNKTNLNKQNWPIIHIQILKIVRKRFQNRVSRFQKCNCSSCAQFILFSHPLSDRMLRVYNRPKCWFFQIVLTPSLIIISQTNRPVRLSIIRDDNLMKWISVGGCW